MQQRLLKMDQKSIVETLKSRGFGVQVHQGHRILVYPTPAFKSDDQPLAAFIWHMGDQEYLGRWSFHLHVSDVFSRQDLVKDLDETTRVNRLHPKLEEAWKQFQATRSAKRWASYLGLVVNLFSFKDTHNGNP